MSHKRDIPANDTCKNRQYFIHRNIFFSAVGKSVISDSRRWQHCVEMLVKIRVDGLNDRLFMFNMHLAITEFDKALRVVAGISSAIRPSPAKSLPDTTLSESERRHSAGLMRVNQVGEVCAQALYQSQSHRARDREIARQFDVAAQEEQDHLGWTTARLHELGASASLLNPIWFAAAYGLGTVAGRMGDATSLAFVVETERQVEAHLTSHLEKLPQGDTKSRAIVEQMRSDEAAHGAHAQSLGAGDLPVPLKVAMRAMSKGMTTLAYYI